MSRRQPRPDLPLDLGSTADRTPEPTLFCPVCDQRLQVYDGWIPYCEAVDCSLASEPRSQREPEDPGAGPRERGEDINAP